MFNAGKTAVVVAFLFAVATVVSIPTTVFLRPMLAEAD